MSLILVDVEASGATPHSGTMTEFGAVEFKTQETFHGLLWEGSPDPENPAKSVPTKRLAEDAVVMTAFRDWLDTVRRIEPYPSRLVFVSDNPAYDFMWIACYFDATLGTNPFGHSARRIGDFAAGLAGDFCAPQRWKRLRRTQHDHHPVHDAMGNAEALEALGVRRFNA